MQIMRKAEFHRFTEWEAMAIGRCQLRFGWNRKAVNAPMKPFVAVELKPKLNPQTYLKRESKCQAKITQFSTSFEVALLRALGARWELEGKGKAEQQVK
jgi:hypothetical protein